MLTPAQSKQLRTALADAGVFRHHEAASWFKLVFCLTVVIACYIGIVVLPHWAAIALIPLAAMFAVTAAMLGHEGSHRSFSASPRRNAILAHIAFPMFGGLGVLHWHNKHDVLHHGHPNVLDHDPDIGLWPMTSCSENHAKSNAFRRWFQRNWQGYAFWPLTTLLGWMMRISSMNRLVFHAKKHGFDGEWFADAAAQAMHYILWLVIPTVVFGLHFGFVLAVYASIWAFVGLMLALVFAPAHIGLPIVYDQNNDWVHQLETTRNLGLPKWLSWFFVGLDYQIEHHLFPKIAHQELPRASQVVQAWCAEVGLPHRTIGYRAAVVDVTVFLANAWKTPSSSGEAVRAGTPTRPLGAAEIDAEIAAEALAHGRGVAGQPAIAP